MKCPHCDTPIDEHKASRCLDAWVDFVVFGAEPRIMSNGQIVGRKFFSTDIAVAWEVVELFRRGKQTQNNGKDSVACNIKLRISDWATIEDCEVIIYSPSLAPALGSGYEMPLAICRAALKAVGE